MSKYVKSMEAMPSNLHLWGSLPTQTAIEEVKKLDFYPVSSIDYSDTIDFIIPKIPKLMLEHVEIVTNIRVLNADGTNPAANNNVSTVPDLAGSLWRNVDVSIGGVSITQSFDNSYTMARFWERVIHTQIATEHFIFMKEGLLLDHVHNKADSENVVFYPVAGEGDVIPKVVNYNGRRRADRIAEGKTISIISDLNASLFRQEKLLPSNLSINISLTKNYSEFILLSAADRTEKVVFDKVILRCTFHKPIDVVLNVIEERLSQEAAIYHADKTELTFQNISEGAQDLTFDNLFTGQLPYCFIVGVQDRAAYGKSRNRNPYTLHSFAKVSLFLDGVEHFPRPVEMIHDEHGMMYNAFLQGIGYINGGDTLMHSHYKAHQVMSFDLTQDNSQNQKYLNLAKTGTARLQIDLGYAAEQNLVLMVLAWYDRILEINQAREVRVI